MERDLGEDRARARDRMWERERRARARDRMWEREGRARVGLGLGNHRMWEREST